MKPPTGTQLFAVDVAVAVGVFGRKRQSTVSLRRRTGDGRPAEELPGRYAGRRCAAGDVASV